MKKISIMLAFFIVAASIPFATATLQITNENLVQSSTDPSKFSMYVTMKNTGNTVEQGVYELAFFPNTYSFFSPQDTCNPQFPYNVHRSYVLNPGESVSFILQSTVPPGTYRAVINHATNCCTSGSNNYDCSAKQPYGLESTIKVVTVGNPTSNLQDECDTDYQALEHLRANGQLNCAVATCNNPTSSSSKAVCTVVGECNNGAKQTQVCGDGVTQAEIRYCNNGYWQLTGDSCSDSAIDPEPSPVSGGGLGGINFKLVGIVLLVFAGIYFLTGGKRR